MQLEELKKEVENKISSTFLGTKLVSTDLAPQGEAALITPKEAIAQWKEKVKDLAINGVEDKEGYAKVTEQIALARTTRTTLEKQRKAEKEDYLNAGRTIDSLFNTLILEIEPAEEALKAKKKVIDDAIEAEKERKANEKRLKVEARSKQLIDLKFVFTGAGYHLQNVTIANAEIELINDELWEEFINSRAKDAYNLQVAEEQEVERLKQEEENRRVIAERTERRKQQLLDNGFNCVEGMYVRPNQSEKFKAIDVNVYISPNVIAEAIDDIFAQVIANAKEDTEQAKTEFNDKLKAFQLVQQQQLEKEQELARKQEELKRQQEEAELTKRTVLSDLRVEKISPYRNYGTVVNFDELWKYSEADFENLLLEKRGTYELAERNRKANEQKAIAEEIKRREEAQKEFEAAEQKRLAKEEAKKPEKQKLLEYAGKLEAIEFPKLKELKADGQVFQSRLADIVADIKELCK